MMKRQIFSTFSALLVAAVTVSACTTAPPAPPEGDGDGDGDTSGTGGGAVGDGDTPGTGGIVGDGDIMGDGDGDIPITGTPVTGEPPYGHPDPAATYPTYDGYTLWLVEEFATPLDLSTDPIWTYSDGGLPEGQVRFVKEGVKFADGKMILEADIDDGAFSYESCSHAEVGEVFTKALTSGEMRTRHNLFRYGRYEVRMKAPTPVDADAAVNGNYIATMFTFRTPKFEDWREIDIEVTGDSPNTVTTNVINGDGQFEWSEGIADAGATTLEVNTRTDFHDFAFEWLPDSITWYVDGQEIRKYVQPAKRPIPEKSAKIMMNLWIFNATAAFGGAELENNTYPMNTEYEWFRFYKWNEDMNYPCKTMNEACLDAADYGLSSNNPCDGIPAEGQITGTNKQACVATCTP